MAIKIDPSGKEKRLKAKNENGVLEYEELKAFLNGGYLEFITLPKPVIINHNLYQSIYIDREMATKRLQENIKATQLVHETGLTKVLLGPTIFCNITPEGNTV